MRDIDLFSAKSDVPVLSYVSSSIFRILILYVPILILYIPILMLLVLPDSGLFFQWSYIFFATQFSIA